MTPKRNDKPKTRRGVATVTFDVPEGQPWTKHELGHAILWMLNHERWGKPRRYLQNFKIRRGSIDMDR